MTKHEILHCENICVESGTDPKYKFAYNNLHTEVNCITSLAV